LDEIDSFRSRHFDLTQLGIDLVNQGAISREDAVGLAPDTPAIGLANLWVSYWSSAWDLKTMEPETLRSHGRWLFQSPAARRWWEAMDGRWSLESIPDRLQFDRILSEECRTAGSIHPISNLDPVQDLTGPSTRSSDRFIMVSSLCIASTAALVLAGRRYLRR
jgi:hypothetical protein